MAIVFDSSDGDGADYLTSTSASTVTGPPLTLACWVNPSTLTGHDACIAVGSSGSNEAYALNLRATYKKVTMESRDSSGGSIAQAADDYRADAWQHVAGVCTSSVSRQAFLDGVGGTVSTTSRTPSSVDRIRIGEWTSTWARPFDGDIAECAIWNVALSAGEIAAMSNGLSPILIRPESLVSYYPLVRDYIDHVGGNTVSPNNTVVWANEHPISVEAAPQTIRSTWGGI